MAQVGIPNFCCPELICTGAEWMGHRAGQHVSCVRSSHRSRGCPQISSLSATSSCLFCIVGVKGKARAVSPAGCDSIRHPDPVLYRHGQDLVCKVDQALAALGSGCFCFGSAGQRVFLLQQLSQILSVQPDFIRTKPTLMQGEAPLMMFYYE